jgi:hypothetical protein
MCRWEPVVAGTKLAISLCVACFLALSLRGATAHNPYPLLRQRSNLFQKSFESYRDLSRQKMESLSL